MLAQISQLIGTMHRTCAILLEKTNTLGSDWIWGDEILAVALGRYLKTFSFQCKIIAEEQIQRTFNAQNFDLVIYFREKFPKKLGKVNVLWLNNALESFHAQLSFQEWADCCIKEQCDRFDVIAAVSPFWCELIEQYGGNPLYFPQFVDTDHYKPRPRQTKFAHDIVYISNNIKGEATNNSFLYPVVQYCLERQINLAIYGAGWENCERWDLVKLFYRKVIASKYVPVIYSNSRLVLNFHFPSHRQFGVLTSRVFEALSCGSMVVSDTVANHAHSFQTPGLTYANETSLLGAIEKALSVPEPQRRSIGARSRLDVVANHSASIRVRTLIDKLKDSNLL